jgi:hypothetical protein
MPGVIKSVAVDLTEDERYMLVMGLDGWGGPAHPTEALAVAMGFDSVHQLEAEGERIAGEIGRREPLTVQDWTRAMVATEFAFASDSLGIGTEWVVIDGRPDQYWIRILRDLQTKVPQARRYLDH